MVETGAGPLLEFLELQGKRVQTEHPDVNRDDPKAAERFQELVAAYNAVMGSLAGLYRGVFWSQRGVYAGSQWDAGRWMVRR